MVFGPNHTYQIGDDAWIFLGNHQGKMTKGKVVAVLELDGYNHKNYVIEIDTPIDPLLEVRSDYAMRPDDPRLREIKELLDGVINPDEVACKILEIAEKNQ